MRKRLFWYVGLYGLLLSVFFGTIIQWVYFRVEDTSYRQQVEHALQSGAIPQPAHLFLGPESQLPASMTPHIRDLPTGTHELELPDSEVHLAITGEPDGPRKVAYIRVEESHLKEGTFVVSTWGAIVITTLLGLAVGYLLVRRIVLPIERLSESLADGDRPAINPGSLPDPELRVLASAVNSHLAQERKSVQQEQAFLSEASHELRNPISILRGVCDLARNTGMTDKLLQRIERSTERMEHTVEGLLALARRDNALGYVCLHDELKSLLHEFKDIKENRIRITREVIHEPDDPLACRMIVIALGTLLRNVVEHASATEVHVQLDRKGLSVCDNGVGIPDEQAIQDCLESLTPLPGGGIGLSMVQRICRRMGWQLHIENTNPGCQVQLLSTHTGES